jgi:hypothetical protein
VQVSDAGEFAAYWNSLTPQQRDVTLGAIRTGIEDSVRCFAEDHPGRVVHLEAELRNVRHALTKIEADRASHAAVIEQAKGLLAEGHDGPAFVALESADTDAALREVRAKALEDAADHVGPYVASAVWLRNRAVEVREGRA